MADEMLMHALKRIRKYAQLHPSAFTKRYLGDMLVECGLDNVVARNLGNAIRRHFRVTSSTWTPLTTEAFSRLSDAELEQIASNIGNRPGVPPIPDD